MRVQFGNEAEPDYAGLYGDAPWIMPWWGGLYNDHDQGFPDLAAGLRMSGRQVGKVLRALLAGTLLGDSPPSRSRSTG